MNHPSPSKLPRYAELHAISNFSFLRGASHPHELVERAHELGYEALALTDECSVAGVVRAHEAAVKCGLALVIGSEFTLSDGLKLVLLARNRSGYGQLSELITLARRRAPKGRYHIARADFTHDLQHCTALLIAPRGAPDKLLHDVIWLKSHFGRHARLACELHQDGEDRAHLAALREIAAEAQITLVASGDVHMHLRSRRPLQDTLSAIRLKTRVADCGHALFPNGERHLRARQRLASVYPSDLLEASVAVAQSCSFQLTELRYEYPEELCPACFSPTTYLRHLTFAGLALRFPVSEGGPSEATLATIEKELKLIAELRYEAFFLTVYDIVRFARSQDILCQGGGSAANSLVCYSLFITEVGPKQTASLLFERFISKERGEPPDIDVDFEHQRREEVIQYIYTKYGRDRAALAASISSYRPKSALRDVGKALGLDLAQVERLAKSMSWWDGKQVLPERIREAGFDPDSPAIQLTVLLVNTLVGFPRHLSQHVGGFVIARNSIAQLCPVENAAMADRSVIQWDKDDLETLGLLKVDVLALGMLTALRRALDLVAAKLGRPSMGLEDIPKEDPAVYAMLQEADSIGVFQVESRAQMSMLPRLKPANYYDLVIEVAIVRPGPIQGGMVHPYLRRREGVEAVEYPSKAVEAVLKRTLGVPIFQEQAMQIAMVAAGFTPGEADQLRRAMAAWKRKGGIMPFEDRLISGMLARGYTPEFAERIFKQLQGFGEYGFPESHAASFALLVYFSAWIKRHHPDAFLAALLNSQPMGFYSPSQLVQDAQRHGVQVLPVDLTASSWDCQLTPPPLNRDSPYLMAVRLGLRLVNGLSESKRDLNGDSPYLMSKKDLQALAAANALLSTVGHRRQAYWEVAGKEDALPLFAGVEESRAPALRAPTEGEDLVADYASLGLTLGRHPMALLRHFFNPRRIVPSSVLKTYPHGRLARAAGIVTTRQRPDTAKGTIFVTLEDEDGYVNVVVWPHVWAKQRRETLEARLMTVYGVWETDGKVSHLIAKRLVDDSRYLGALTTHSRDFH